MHAVYSLAPRKIRVDQSQSAEFLGVRDYNHNDIESMVRTDQRQCTYDLSVGLSSEETT